MIQMKTMNLRVLLQRERQCCEWRRCRISCCNVFIFGQNEIFLEQLEKVVIEPTREENREIKREREVKMNIEEKDRSIEIVLKQKGPVERKRMRWKTCIENFALVNKFCYNVRIPPICTLNGTEARNKTEQDHVDSEAHKEFLRANKLKMLSTKEEIQTVPLFKIADTRKNKVANKMGKLAIQVYNDVKSLSVSAQSFGHQGFLQARLLISLI